MAVFDPRPGRAGSIAPGKSRFSSLCPTIAFQDGKPVHAGHQDVEQDDESALRQRGAGPNIVLLHAGVGHQRLEEGRTVLELAHGGPHGGLDETTIDHTVDLVVIDQPELQFGRHLLQLRKKGDKGL